MKYNCCTIERPFKIQKNDTFLLGILFVLEFCIDVLICIMLVRKVMMPCGVELKWFMNNTMQICGMVSRYSPR